MKEKNIDKFLNININLPSLWEDKIQNLALEKKQSLSELIIDIIGEYLDDNLTDIDQLPHNYQQLHERITALEEKHYVIQRLQSRLDITEKLVASLQNNFTSRPFQSLTHSLIIDDDMEDEPDEILTDFLD